MSSPSSPTLSLDLRERRWDARVAIAASFAAATAPWLLVRVVGWPAVACSSLLILVICVVGFHRANWLGPKRLVRAVWQSDGCWLLTETSGRTYMAMLAASTRMSPFAIWLRWESQDSFDAAEWMRRGQVATLLLFRGDLPTSDFRRLLVRLRMDRSEWQPLTTRIAHP